MTAEPSRPRDRWRGPRQSWLTALMALSIALIVAVGVWDESREDDAALREFELEQSELAAVVAASVTAQLDVVRADARLVAASRDDDAHPRSPARPYDAIHVLARAAPRTAPPPGHVLVSVPVEPARRVDVVLRPAQLLAAGAAGDPGDLVLVRPPGEVAFQSATGERLASAPLRVALARGQRATRLSRAEASALHLPERVAIAGTAWAGGGELGRWGVAVIASAGRERDRQQRARWRLVFGVVLAGGLVLAFGGYARRAQRKELELARELTLADLEQQRDEQLARDGRAATMLTLAAGVAHEISTPLSVIHGRAEQLRERLRDDRDARAVQRILEQTARIEGVIRGFLRLARGDAPTLEQLDPAGVVREAAALVEHRFAKAGVRLHVAPEADLPPVRGDRRLLEHAMVNLLLNACDASERGDTVRVTARHDADGDATVFEVHDEGGGISPDLAAHVTQPFFSTKPPGQGTGLGLAIASEIVKIHRGELALVPREPRGTRATVRVPNPQGATDASTA